jgi:undecaprenyl diphosphate synthase
MSAPASSAETATLPRHVAVIMDGNGRWARVRGRPRTFGHSQGVEALRRTVEAAGASGVPYLTVFGFSTENWRRPAEEVNALLDLLRIYVARDLEKLTREGVRVRVIGARENLAPDILDIITNAEAKTAGNSNLNLTIAFNYDSQSEIVRAAKKIAQDVVAGRIGLNDIDEALFAANLDTAELPPPDLIIRTSGEQRISNFLLWQAAYAELMFLDIMWPDFDEAAFAKAIEQYRARDRRFGGSDRAGPA